MELSYKWLIVLLCTVALNFLTVVKTKSVFAQEEQEELNQTPCPSTLLWAVLKGDYDMGRFLLERGADPNASLENCQIVITNDAVVLFNEEDEKQLFDAWSISVENSTFSFERPVPQVSRLRGMPGNSSLLHIAARICRPPGGQYTPASLFLYRLLVRHGGDETALDARAQTPIDVVRSHCRR